MVSFLEDWGTGESVTPYDPNPENYYYGRVPESARSELDRQDQGWQWGRGKAALADQQAGQLRKQGSAYDNQARTGFYQSNNARAQQQQAFGATMDFARQGQGPSVAEAQLRQGMDAGMSQNLAMARSGRGMGGNAAAMRQAMFANAAQSQQTNQQASVLRAQENDMFRNRQLAALGQAGQMAGSMRSSDLSGAQLGTQGALGFEGAAGNQNRLGLDYSQQAQGYEQMRQNILANQLNSFGSMEGVKSQNIMNAQQLNQAEDRSRDGLIMGLISDRDAKQNIEPVTVQPYAPQQQDGGAAGGSGGDGGGVLGSIIGLLSDEREKKEKKPARPALEEALSRLSFAAGGDGGIASKLRALGESGQPEMRQPDYEGLDAAYRAQGGTPNVPTQRFAMPELRQPNYAGLDAAYRAQGGTPVEAEAQRAMAKAPGYKYEYKDPARHGEGTHYGPMAQDLEKTPVGKSVVKETPDGTKMVDTSRLSLVNTAALSGQQKRLSALEQELAKLEAIGAEEEDEIKRGARGSRFVDPRR